MTGTATVPATTAQTVQRRPHPMAQHPCQRQRREHVAAGAASHDHDGAPTHAAPRMSCLFS